MGNGGMGEWEEFFSVASVLKVTNSQSPFGYAQGQPIPKKLIMPVQGAEGGFY